MNDHVEAVYENGVFRSLEPVKLPEHQRVTVHFPDVPESANNHDDPIGTLAPWTDEMNARRCDLIDKEIEGTITHPEAIELQTLQSQAIAYRDHVAPLPIDGARKLHQELLRRSAPPKGRTLSPSRIPKCPVAVATAHKGTPTANPSVRGCVMNLLFVVLTASFANSGARSRASSTSSTSSRKPIIRRKLSTTTIFSTRAVHAMH